LTKTIADANWLCHYLQVHIINELKFRDISFDVRGLHNYNNYSL